MGARQRAAQAAAPASQVWRSRRRIREDLEEFFGVNSGRAAAEPIELWAWVAAYDHVALCQLWGPMPDLPRAIRVSPASCGNSGKTGAAPDAPRSPDAHDALVDARDQLRRFRLITAGD